MRALSPWRPIAIAAALLSLSGLDLRAADPPDFKPDAAFSGSSLSGWRPIGQADWQAQNGEIIGRPSGADGGWLVMDRPLQDLQFFAHVRCSAPCRTGVLVRAEKTADGGLKGIYASFGKGDFVTYRLTIGADGREVSRERIGNPPTAPNAVAAAAAADLGSDWAPIRVYAWGNTVQTIPGAAAPLGDDGDTGYGSVALFVGGGEARFKDVAWKNVNRVELEKEQVSPRFTPLQINTLYYGWSAVASDVNHDGANDIVSGPFYYLGPGFTERRIYRSDRVYNPATEYAPDMVNFTYDYTGDGWPDILASGWDRQKGTRPIDLYVNPKGADRRWDHTTVLATPNTESVLMRDLDGDGHPEMIFGSADGYAWARPDASNPTAPWTVHVISGAGQPKNIHGMGGVGDVNGDKRADVVVASGWYEQPANLLAGGPWTFHPVDFATATTEMGVYDVNGDGLTDVVASLSVHGWGLAWYEQKKGSDGSATFVRHDIAGDYSTKNAGGVAFAEAHAARFVDMSGDNVPDFIVGKRYWSHLETYRAPIDPYGPAVIYIYKTVRNPNAPGGAEFVPELVHNRSGVGSAFEVADINQDGKPDIAVATAFGTHVFLAK